MVVTRSTKTAAPAASQRAGRKRKATDDDDESTIVVKRRRTDRSGNDADMEFLQDTLQEIRKLKYPKRTQRFYVVDLLKRYIPLFERPTKEDAHFFETTTKARQFLTDSDEFDIPVFVKRGCNFSIIDPKSEVRPIEQMFQFYPNLDEEIPYFDMSQPRKDSELMQVGELQQRLEAHNGFVKYPVNFPDIPTSVPDFATPSFVVNSNCAMLSDLVREYLHGGMQRLCHCPKGRHGIPKCGHTITERELVELSDSWQYWQGTTMIADAGAATPAHWDKYGLATWLSCIEGEVGFAWLSNPSSEDEHTRWLLDPENPTGRWVFKVLRPGDALYMPPGTVHFVFRRPHGTQTFGFAGHMLRQQELVKWLRILNTEIKLIADDDTCDVPYSVTMAPVMRGVRNLVKHAKKYKREDRFGGKAKLNQAMKLVAKIEKQLDDLDKSD